MKLCFIAYTLAQNGFTSSLVSMMRLLAESGIDVSLMLFESCDPSKYQLDEIHIFYNEHPYKKYRKWVCFFTSFFSMKSYLLFRFGRNGGKAVEREMTWTQCLAHLNVQCYVGKINLLQYDCIIAWEEVFPAYYLSEKVTARKKIGYVHADYAKGKFNKRLDVMGYRGLDHIAAVSTATAEVLRRQLPEFETKIIAIPNVIETKQILSKAQQPQTIIEKKQLSLITVCRLDNKSKALDRLVRVAARLRHIELDFRWYVVGDGADKNNLEYWIKNAEMENVVILVGSKDNPYSIVKSADLFVLQSYYEGQPISISEALVLNVPVLVSNYESAREQVIDGVTGFIADNNEQAIFDKMKYVLEHPELLEKIRGHLEQKDKKCFENIGYLLQAVKSK